jgi:thiol:disulfide interchange protein
MAAGGTLMRHVRVLAGLAALVLVAACENGGSAPAPSGAHAAGWLPDLEAGMKEAKASNRPILVDFGADW